MATGTPYVPPALATSFVPPNVASPDRILPYLSPSQYRFAPTAVGTQNLFPKSTNPDTDSLAVLADVMTRASDWADTHVFGNPISSFAAGPTTEQMWVKVKADGTVAITCNQRPVLEITALALGPAPGSLAGIDSITAQNLWVNDRNIYVPFSWSTGSQPYFPRPVGPGAGCYVVWTYISGYAHCSLGGTSYAAGATSLTLIPAFGNTSISGIYPGSAMRIVDGASTETVTITALPVGNTVTCSPLAYGHFPPQAPDFIPVTDLPHDVEQAVIYLANVIIKTRGSRALVLQGAPGSQPTRSAMAQAGALDDYDSAVRMLHRFVVPTLHG